MPSEATRSSLVDVLLRPAFVLGVLLVAGFAYSAVVLQRIGPFLMAVTTLGSIAITVLVVWLLYRLVVAVEDLAETARRLEAANDDE